jgi:hypothetical protein
VRPAKEDTMTRFASPALHQPDLPLSVAAMRGVLVLAALVFTAALWFAVGAEAGRFGDNDTTPRFELEPVVISGHRVLPDDTAMALRSAVPECGNTPSGGGQNRVTLTQ